MKKIGLMQAIMLTRKADRLTEERRSLLQQNRLQELVRYVKANSPF